METHTILGDSREFSEACRQEKCKSMRLKSFPFLGDDAPNQSQVTATYVGNIGNSLSVLLVSKIPHRYHSHQLRSEPSVNWALNLR